MRDFPLVEDRARLCARFGDVLPPGPVTFEDTSPRIVPMPVINPDEVFASDPNGLTNLTIRNILGFFVERQEGQGGQTLTVGRLVNVPGQSTGGNTVNTSSSFIKTIQLIR